jgi:hypothetical protein
MLPVLMRCLFTEPCEKDAAIMRYSEDYTDDSLRKGAPREAFMISENILGQARMGVQARASTVRFIPSRTPGALSSCRTSSKVATL